MSLDWTFEDQKGIVEIVGDAMRCYMMLPAVFSADLGLKFWSGFLCLLAVGSKARFAQTRGFCRGQRAF